MKKYLLLLFVLSIFILGCEPKLEQTTFTITKVEACTETINDSINARAKNFCIYHISGDNHALSIADTLGKFQIGDTMVFTKRVTMVIDTLDY